MVTFSRHWAMPNSATFTIKPIKELLDRLVSNPDNWIDPFAGFNSPAKWSNDLNPAAPTMEHKKAEDFLSAMPHDCPFDGILFDPPYSPRQISECYKSVGLKVTQKDTQLSGYIGGLKKLVPPLIKQGGLAICFGWNSCGIGKTLGFELEEVMLVNHGGGHYDTIVTVERKL